VETLALNAIRMDGGTQARAQTDWLVVDDYVHAMQDNASFPPVVVFFDGTDYWLADGFHRAEAGKRAGLATIAAEVRQGTRRDAVLWACGANAAHGLRRTNADKRRAVLTLLDDPEWQKWSDAVIAQKCAVSDFLVRTMRPQVTPIKSESEQRKGADGRTINTARIGHRRPEPAAWGDHLNNRFALSGIPEEYEEAAQSDEQPHVGEVHEEHDCGTVELSPATLPEHSPALPPPNTQQSTTPAPPVSIINADAQQVGELVDTPVHLVITSPPYNVGIAYDQHNDNLTTHLPMLQNVWRGCHAVMAEGARICVVVPFGVGRSPYVPFDSAIMQGLTDAGFTVRGRIVWDKNTTGNRTSWGSFRLPSNPALRDTTECIIVAHKGDGTLILPEEVRRRDEKGTFTEWLADSDYFMELAQDHWVVAPESAQRVKHPAPFPVDLVTRLIHFYGFPGCHVLDPFGGSGTTAVSAKRLGCQATLVELSADYCALAQERLHD
jgi:DNA modification methylase